MCFWCSIRKAGARNQGSNIRRNTRIGDEWFPLRRTYQ
ncbi:hypothetical protein Pint_19990 [Pistacia integerrima]|uniref:Uncharacterized protein n=1 Tax=Pistacia integerrima TaxID=434235 RepID=A0ACC0XCU2_9ROSI|nr:hypothetical protein Pint_19990 [Pistacia integerrima]